MKDFARKGNHVHVFEIRRERAMFLLRFGSTAAVRAVAVLLMASVLVVVPATPSDASWPYEGCRDRDTPSLTYYFDSTWDLNSRPSLKNNFNNAWNQWDNKVVIWDGSDGVSCTGSLFKITWQGL